ncbi:hypothetical protein [Thermaurantimonas aggregans]|nr:hypothetical protein [Thermaurantimonas aggregans]MCX8148531.1 hypothetical protein [Thermaurantimonas aggregans]
MVHKAFGPRLFESVYMAALHAE